MILLDFIFTTFFLVFVVHLGLLGLILRAGGVFDGGEGRKAEGILQLVFSGE